MGSRGGRGMDPGEAGAWIPERQGHGSRGGRGMDPGEAGAWIPGRQGHGSRASISPSETLAPLAQNILVHSVGEVEVVASQNLGSAPATQELNFDSASDSSDAVFFPEEAPDLALTCESHS